jgi:hypothetical protein
MVQVIFMRELDQLFGRQAEHSGQCLETGVRIDLHQLLEVVSLEHPHQHLLGILRMDV